MDRGVSQAKVVCKKGGRASSSDSDDDDAIDPKKKKGGGGAGGGKPGSGVKAKRPPRGGETGGTGAALGRSSAGETGGSGRSSALGSASSIGAKKQTSAVNKEFGKPTTFFLASDGASSVGAPSVLTTPTKKGEAMMAGIRSGAGSMAEMAAASSVLGSVAASDSEGNESNGEDGKEASLVMRCLLGEALGREFQGVDLHSIAPNVSVSVRFLLCFAMRLVVQNIVPLLLVLPMCVPARRQCIHICQQLGC